MNSEKRLPSAISYLREELQYLRQRPLSKQKKAKTHRFSKPVASFSKPDRLKSGMGTEITLIFRSRACSWAGSASGGCTMCGYWNDRAEGDITSDHYWLQFISTIEKFKSLLEDHNEKIVFKMFTSGSFCDPKELDEKLQLKILQKLADFESIKEIVLESRPEYLTSDLLTKYRQIIQEKYLEIGIGIESSSDYIRANIINKGFNWRQIVQAVERVHAHNFGVKAYLLFKPPFLSEYTALMDLFQSIRDCVQLGVDTISINPTNIQQNTVCSVLASQNQFRSPWFYSLFWIIKHAISQEELKHIRLLCDPSAAGKERGIHNFYSHHPSNSEAIDILQKFVKHQDLSIIPELINDKESLVNYNRYRTEILYKWS
ncbi:archaeosine biosynthesis radical SAM protein RaSEA [Candidatus Harpocratesius sp.]